MFKVVLLTGIIAGFYLPQTVSPRVSTHSEQQRSLLMPRYGQWGIDLAGMDSTIRPGSDFYLYSNGGWVAQEEIPADQVSSGYFRVLSQLSKARVRSILEDPHASSASSSTPLGKASILYNAYLNEAKIESIGSRPLKRDLLRLREVKSRAQLTAMMGRRTCFCASLFDLTIEKDERRPDGYALYLGQGGLGLPDREYYLSPGFAGKKAEYEAYIAKLLDLIGWKGGRQQAHDIVEFETGLAQASWTRAEQREATKTYNPIQFSDLQSFAPGIEWHDLSRSFNLSDVREVVLTTPSSVQKIAAIYQATSLATLKAWEAFRMADMASAYLPREYANARFEFRSNVLAGQPKQTPRWEQGVSLINEMLGSAVGEAYVKLYFPSEDVAKMDAIVSNLRLALDRRLDELDWMSPSTRQEAKRKLASIEVQIGYPKRWKDYTSLSLQKDDVYHDVLAIRQFEWLYRVHKLGQVWDKNDWRTWPQEVTAYTDNRQLIFPAAMLQPPFFDKDADAAVNYGAIGQVIGHELTHSFDDQGRKEDADGRLRDWWAVDDAARFTMQADILSKQYSAMEPIPGFHVKGDVTLGENIADLGGLKIASLAYHLYLDRQPAPVLDGLTGDQRFFLGFAQVWRAKLRDDALRKQIVSDVHSPGKERVNGVVRNMEEWYAAFHVNYGDPMYLSPKERVNIW